jgi:hypothetical protein
MIRPIGDGIQMKDDEKWLLGMVSIRHPGINFSCIICILPMKNGYWGIHHVQDPPSSGPYGPYVNSEQN